MATGALASSRAAMASYATFPEHSTTRRMDEASETEGSSSTSWNDPETNSSTFERDVRARRIDLGVKTIKGLRTSRRTWRRSRWKYWAAVVALATWMLSSAHSVRKRSMRA